MRHEDVARLLQDGAVILHPDEGLRSAAEQLESLGLIEVERAEFVRCANPVDSDFPRSDRTCPGQIILPADYDEVGGEFRCPQCDRLVFPDVDSKMRHGQLRATIQYDGVVSYLRTLLTDAVEVAAGVLRAPVGILGAFVCVVDTCQDAKFLSRDWARTQPTCYVVVDRRLAGRFLPEDWIHRVLLADVLTGRVNLEAAVVEAAEAGPPVVVQNASVPVCAAGVRPVVETDAAPQVNRCFVVQLTDETVFIEGEPVMSAQADTRYLMFRLLWERFLEDLRDGVAPEHFRALDLASMLRELSQRSGRQLVDEMTIRRTINRLQADLMNLLRRKRGLPAQREDIVETCRWAGQGQRQYGYRLNPRTVAVRA